MNSSTSEFRLPPSRVTRLAIVILTWNGKADTLACLESLAEAGHPRRGESVVVVDNGSTDGTVAEVKAHFPEAVVIQNGSNLGFAAGNNVGLSWALNEDFDFDAVLLLNNDTLVTPGALEALAAELEAHPEAGSVQPVLVSHADPSRLDSLGIRVGLRPGAVDAGMGAPVESLAPAPEEIFGACAACALYRCEALKQVGLLDASFFAILEDVDLAFRLRLAGWGSRLVKSARVAHRRGISKTDPQGGLRRALILANLQVVMWRYWPARSLLLTLPLWLRWRSVGADLWRAMGRLPEYRGRISAARRQRAQLKQNPRWQAIQREWLA